VDDYLALSECSWVRVTVYLWDGANSFEIVFQKPLVLGFECDQTFE
jgi:hypothetical protein